MPRLDLTLEPKPAEVRRIEMITGGERRRRWSDDAKARAVEASLAPGAVVSVVARQHGATPQQLFTWRREARRKAGDETNAPAFIPAMVEAPSGAATPTPQTKSDTAARPPIIELDIDGSSVWIWRGAETTMVTAIVGALKGRK